MVNTGITVSEELLDEFDDQILQLKAAGEIRRNASRSEVIRILMKEFVEGNATPTSTHTEREATTAAAN
jgi:metal-responsive CopG/Arc/MetJ family transcriptional regulator